MCHVHDCIHVCAKYSDRYNAQSTFFLIYSVENGMSLLSKGLHSNVSEFLQFTETGKMVKLIEEFKKEHSLIVDTLSKSRKIGVDSREGQDKILSAKDFILAHLKKEDEKLYPLLRKAAKSSQRLKELLGEFDKDMNEITSYTLEFFNDYTATTGSELAMELEKFVTMLERRILREETFLFAEFEKLHE